MFAKIYNFIVTVMNAVLTLLPDCPFLFFLNAIEDSQGLRCLNWFIPISDFVVIGEAWLVAITIFYVYQVLLRWVKVIQS